VSQLLPPLRVDSVTGEASLWVDFLHHHHHHHQQQQMLMIRMKLCLCSILVLAPPIALLLMSVVEFTRR
jgi:hypothetical protein